MASTRFPGKPLVDLAGKPMLQWVVERARDAQITDRVIVATPDREIVQACKLFNAEAVLTSIDHPTGTDRIAEVARSIKADVYVNVQGDEPLVQPEDIRACAQPLMQDSKIQMGSVFADCPDEEVDNPAVVKVVTARNGDALYFSRHPIPYPRNDRQGVKKHIGLYAYTAEVLEGFSKWPQSPLEQAESLEQLRFLENGVRIRMSKGTGSALAVDTPEQADQVRAILAAG
jgi:3-deoxy-manno-octulosonate cytidylyltransferase (CMP-KDO synthetase)